MCRLLAIMSDTAITAQQALGDEQLAEFTALSDFHNDGWGAAWTGTDGRIESCSSIIEAEKDPQFEQLTHHNAATEQLIHLRWASEGMATVAENSHPFVRDGYAFMHNGNIAAPQLIDPMLDDEAHALVRGGTDSERFFAYILQCCRQTGDTEAGIIKAVEDTKKAFPHRSLNSLILHDGKVYVINVHAGAEFNVDDDPYRREHLPWQHNEQHYHELVMRRDAHTIIVASTGIQNGDYETLPEGSIFVLSREQGVPAIRTLWEGR
ncbi:glutamine amidotransferase, class-II [Bifidobacterium goeldii]|uniref:Glutamine amidotransferase, class-II n=1 Tax=Bifidobacterium goeldii TaxID=2306975 RepID=A0A430FHJ8_9BIFI|nr:class II glutamine amidotransferase [Bifidobacterium goeldii]RSX52168.1 glutamine amidotransferase, class-II [Bifidobacterium goeldii]